MRASDPADPSVVEALTSAVQTAMVSGRGFKTARRARQQGMPVEVGVKRLGPGDEDFDVGDRTLKVFFRIDRRKVREHGTSDIDLVLLNAEKALEDLYEGSHGKPALLARGVHDLQCAIDAYHIDHKTFRCAVWTIGRRATMQAEQACQ